MDLDYSAWPLYFFSTLAQSAAGFAALVAVFAVYRLQSNITIMEALRIETREWLLKNGRTVSQDPQNIDYLLIKLDEIIRDSSSANRPHALKLRQKILVMQELPKKLPYMLSCPLKMWGFAFILSLGYLAIPGIYPTVLNKFPMLNLYAKPFTIVVPVLLTVFALFALWKSKRFVQDCLSHTS